MAVTVLIEPLPGYPQATGAKLEVIAKVTLSGTYDTGGFSLYTGAHYGFSGIEFIEGSYEVNNYLRWLGWKPKTGAVLQVTQTGNEVANGVNVTGDVYIVKTRGM